MNKKTKYIWYLVASGFVILFLLILTSSVIDIGERLRSIGSVGIYIEWSFYVISILLIWFLIVNPIRIILTSPSLSIATTLEKDSLKARRIYKNVSKNILSNNQSLTNDEKFALENYSNYNELREALTLCMSGTVKKEIRKIIVRNAKAVMLSTAISQNSKLDMYSVVSLNLKMIKEIVVACGFRPSMKNLSKLTINVISTALVADGLETLNMEDVLPTSTVQSLSEIPLLKPILSSVVSGMANALLTIRIGLVTRGYLFSDSKSVTKNMIRAEAFKDALTILPQVMGEFLAYFPSKVIKLFTKKKDGNTGEDPVTV